MRKYRSSKGGVFDSLLTLSQEKGNSQTPESCSRNTTTAMQPSYKNILFAPDSNLSFLLAFIIFLRIPAMSNPASKASYKTYCFQHSSHIMFFYYNHNHPIMTKNYKFELGRVKIFSAAGRVLSCQLTSNPHLNLSLDWNEEYFAKLFHGLARFELEGSGDEYDDSLSLLVRDHFEEGEEIFLMRAKLTEEYGFDLTNQFWHIFKNYNVERLRTLEGMAEENAELARKADEQLVRLVALQDRKEREKDRLKGQLSALLREKENKLKEFNENFRFIGCEREMEPSLDPEGQKETMSIAGSLFQDSQEFIFPS